jgi:hypothetical protein
MERGVVTRPVPDVCKGGQIRVAWNWSNHWFGVNITENKMRQYEYASLSYRYTKHITFPYEILTSFLNMHQLIPTFLWANQSWGRALGMVSGYSKLVLVL